LRSFLCNLQLWREGARSPLSTTLIIRINKVGGPSLLGSGRVNSNTQKKLTFVFFPLFSKTLFKIFTSFSKGTPSDIENIFVLIEDLANQPSKFMIKKTL